MEFPFLALSSWCSVCFLYRMASSFLSLDKFSPRILLKIWSLPLDWDSSPTSMPIIWSLVFWWCPILPVCSFHMFKFFYSVPCFFFVCFLFLFLFLSTSFTLSSSAHILSPAGSILLLGLSLEFSNWVNGFLNFIFFYAWGFSHVPFSLQNSVLVDYISLLFVFSWVSLRHFPLSVPPPPVSLSCNLL